MDTLTNILIVLSVVLIVMLFVVGAVSLAATKSERVMRLYIKVMQKIVMISPKRAGRFAKRRREENPDLLEAIFGQESDDPHIKGVQRMLVDMSPEQREMLLNQAMGIAQSDDLDGFIAENIHVLEDKK